MSFTIYTLIFTLLLQMYSCTAKKKMNNFRKIAALSVFLSTIKEKSWDKMPWNLCNVLNSLWLHVHIWKFKYALRRPTFLINWLDEYIVCKLKNPTPILNYSISQSLKILGDKGTMVSTLSFIDTGVYRKHNWLFHVIPIFYIDQLRLHIERPTLHLSLQRTSFDHMHCLTTTYLQR